MTDEDLLALATDVANRTLEACRGFDWKGISSLESQLQRAAVSVPSNITEGIGRDHPSGGGSRKSKTRFYLIAYGSLRECVLQLELLRRQKPHCGDLVVGLMEDWSAVRRELLAIVDGVPPAEDSAVQKASVEQGALPKLSEVLPSSLGEFIAQAKESYEALRLYPIRTNEGGIVFRLKAFQNFLGGRKINARTHRLTLELRKLGWMVLVKRFGTKTSRVWSLERTTTKWMD